MQPTDPSSSQKSIRILLVEDNIVNQQVAVRQLRKLGYAVDTAANGAQALEALKRQRYPLILMDCQMPEMDGYEATWQIRHGEEELARTSTEPPPRVYIIAMTANTQEDDRAKCLAAGMNDYITKPVQLPELEAALQRGLRGPQPGDDILDPLVMAGLRQLREPGQPDPVEELVELFFKDAPALLEAIERGIAGRDMAGTIAAASSLKGSARNLGAKKFAEICAEIEQTARSGILAEAKPVLQQAQEEFCRVKTALELELKK